MKEVIEMLLEKVNVHGELHLDAVQAKIIIGYLRTVDAHFQLQEKLIVDLFEVNHELIKIGRRFNPDDTPDQPDVFDMSFYKKP